MPRQSLRALYRICEKLPLRVSAASFSRAGMLSLSVPDKYAMERLGLATPGMIKAVYKHIMSDKREEVNEAVNGAVEGMVRK